MGWDAGGADEQRSTVRVSETLRRPDGPGGLRGWLRGRWLWLLVDADRWAVVAALSGGVFVAVVGAVLLGPPSVLAYLVGGTALAKGYVELQTLVVTVITVVLAINQLVLSPELGSLGRQRSRLDDVLENRSWTEAVAGVPTAPTEPDEYLRVVTEATRDRALRLREATADADDPEVRAAVDDYVDDVVRQTERAAAVLEDARFGTTDMLGAAMHVTTAEEIRRIRDLRARHADALSDEEAAAVDEMLEVLELYTVAREYFRALYVQWEFINFSRAILVIGLPAVVVAHLTIGFVDANAFPGSVFGVRNLFWYESLAFAVTVTPVSVVVSYAARLSMIARASIFVSPFRP